MQIERIQQSKAPEPLADSKHRDTPIFAASESDAVVFDAQDERRGDTSGGYTNNGGKREEKDEPPAETPVDQIPLSAAVTVVAGSYRPGPSPAKVAEVEETPPVLPVNVIV